MTIEIAGALRGSGVDAGVVLVGTGDKLVTRLENLRVPFDQLGLPRGRVVVRHPRSLARLVARHGSDAAVLVSSGYLAGTLRAGGYRGPVAAVEHGTLLQVARLPMHRRALKRVDRASGLWACDVEVAVSPYMFDVLSARRHAPSLVCIQNGVDLARFSPAGAADFEPGRLRLGYAGRLVEGKGLPALLHAVAAVGAGVELRVAGDGPSRPRVEALARSLGVEGRVQFLGQIADVASFWRGCHVGVVPSDALVESFSLSAVEAMATGRPVIASRLGALPETIGPDAGILVEPGNSGELAAAIRLYAGNSSTWEVHGRNARAACEARYDFRTTVRGYAALVATLVSDGRGRRRGSRRLA